MTPDRIDGATHELRAPVGWDVAEHGPCEKLPVRVVGECCESAWRPTPEEIEFLQAGGMVVLRIYGRQPAVALYVEAAHG
jgi:hypothetical protein